MSQSTPTSNFNVQDFYSTTLSSAITSSDTTIPLVAAPTPTEGFLVIEPDSSTNREIIMYTSVSGSNVVCGSTGDRGIGGTTARAHSSGVTVKMNTVSDMFKALKTGRPSGLVFSNNTVAAPSSYLDLRGNGSTGAALHLPLQTISSNSYPTKQLIQQGWGFIQGNASNHKTSTITFPIAYSSAPIVFAHVQGMRSGSDPAAIGDLNLATGPQVGSADSTAYSITTSQATIVITVGVAANWTSTYRIGYSWIAIGTVS